VSDVICLSVASRAPSWASWYLRLKFWRSICPGRCLGPPTLPGKQYLFVIALLIAFVVLSLLADRSAKGQRVVTGTVTVWRAGESIKMANESTDSTAFAMQLRPTTAYEGDTRRIGPGARVTVWYRNVGDRHFVVDRIRVLDTARH
jgi:hypothetical protein